MIMLSTNITNFRKNIYSIGDQVIGFNEPVNICSKNGNAVLMSEDEYRGLIETLYINSKPELKSKILEGMNTPLSECIPEDEADW
jgi:PHD/YefM family antitoxin component YafN of YafNO toxin-antitoxin module